MNDSSTTPRKVGNAEVKVSLDLLRRLRAKVRDLRAQYPSYTKLGEALMPEFPSMSPRTFLGYVTGVAPEYVSDYVFGLFEEGKITANLYLELAHGNLDRSTRDELARQAVERRLTTGQVADVKRQIAKGKVLLATAIMRATGDLPKHAQPEIVKESVKEFGGVVREVNDAALKFMAKLQTALDLMPGSMIDTPANYMDLKEKMSTFKVTLKNSLNFVEESDKRLLEIVKAMVTAEAMMQQGRTPGGSTPT